MICPKCRGVGRIPFGEEPEIYTNEEWLRQCNTEQLAEFLFHVRYDGQTPWKGSSIWEWLKQSHTVKE